MPIFIFYLILILYSCEKEDNGCSVPDYSYLDDRLYPLLFDEGSYWIYKNELDNRIGSVALIEKTKSTLTFNTGHGCSNVEEVYYLSYTSLLQFSYTDLYLGYVISRGDPSGGYIYLSSHDVGDESLNARIEAVYDTLIVENVMYKGVVKMCINKDAHINSAMNLYYVDSIGIIKKEIKEGEIIKETWNLIRSLPLLFQKQNCLYTNQHPVTSNQ